MKSLIAALIVVICCAGCHGPLGSLFVNRLDAQEQARVNSAWDRLLTRFEQDGDRTLLLDVLAVGQLHQAGVDRLDFTSAIELNDGEIEMSIRYKRGDPRSDVLTIRRLDPAGEPLWQEDFAFEEVRDRLTSLQAGFSPPSPDRMYSAAELAQQQRVQAELEARRRAIHEILGMENNPGAGPTQAPWLRGVSEDASPAR